MNKLFIAVIAGAVASVAMAQTPNQVKQDEVRAATAGGVTTAQGTAAKATANVNASKKVAKMPKSEKAAATNAATNAGVTTAQGTANKAAANVNASKATTAQRPALGTPQAQNAMQKASTP